MKFHSKIITILLILSLAFTGCGKKDKKHFEPPKLSAVNEKFIALARDQFGYEDIQVREAGKTLWIYLPMRKRIVDIKASKGQPKKTVEISEKMTVKNIEAAWDNDALQLSYDIQKSKSYQKDQGYSSNYSEDYSQAQQELMQAVSRVYFEFAEDIRLNSDTPHEPKELPGVPNFIMMVIADIEKGVEIESMFYFQDLQKAMSMIPAITGDEFMRRYVAEVRGNMAIIDDVKGEHLNYRDVDMKEFLARQIENRVNFKYGHSAKPPSDDVREELLAVISDALQAYQYFAVLGVTFKDQAADTTETISKTDLMAFIDAHLVKEPSKGRIINIKFGL